MPKLSHSDPIAALASAPGTSAIALIRLSGDGVIDIVASHFKKAEKLLGTASHTAVFGSFWDADKVLVDEVLCWVYRAPHSYTGEDMVEISCHGNPRIVSIILQNLWQKCRMAEPGEFTKRAYLNGKLDLSRAEAVQDLINSQTSKAASAAMMQLKGKLSKHLQQIVHRINTLRIKLELMIDFSDQDLPMIHTEELCDELNALKADMQELKLSGKHGILIREGIKVCLAGAPNAGKSSVFNAFLKQNRAIVTPHPGTTRDYLEEVLSLHGYSLVLYDTAGLRDTTDDIENQGIKRAYELMQASDIILYLIDAEALGSEELVLNKEEIRAKWILALNKTDLFFAESLPSVEHCIEFMKKHGYSEDIANQIVPCSAILSDGLREVEAEVLKRLNLPEELSERPMLTNARHLAALDKALVAIENARVGMMNGVGYEFVAFDLIEAANSLGEIFGTISSDALLNMIFSDFCIGK